VRTSVRAVGIKTWQIWKTSNESPGVGNRPKRVMIVEINDTIEKKNLSRSRDL
jgi:hypothetical protein